MLARDGYLDVNDLSLPSARRLAKGAVAIAECLQQIPCNPCQDACKRGAFRTFRDINDLPTVDYEKCNGCGACISRCPGLAIFVVDETYSSKEALIKIPYEFTPLPQENQVLTALDRAGDVVGEARVVRVQSSKAQDRTAVLWLAVSKELAMTVRHIRP